MLNCNEGDDPLSPAFNTDNNLSQAQIDWLQTDVDLVLQGHDHIYARSKPINADNVAVKETLKTESFNGHNISYDVKPGAPVYLIPGTAGPKTYYKNKAITTDPTANGYDPNFYSLFDKAVQCNSIYRRHVWYYQISSYFYKNEEGKFMENLTKKILVIMVGLALSVGASTTVYATATSLGETGRYATPTQVSKTCQTAGARDKIDAQAVVALCEKNKNAKIAARVVYLQIGAISAANGIITLTYNNPLASTPEISDFVVTQTIGTGAAITVKPTAVVLDQSKKIVVLTLPKVAALPADQSIVYTVSYDTAVPVTASGFKVVAEAK